MSGSARIEDLRRRVHRDPASIAFAQLAEECRRAGQCGDAVQVCRSGLAIHPGYLSARVTLGRALIELGELDSARHELELVLVSAPDNLAAIRGLGEILQRRGLAAEALVHYRRALGLARNDPDLEQTVADLTRELARTPVRSTASLPLKPAPAAELLTLEQLTQELEANAVAAPAITPSTVTIGLTSALTPAMLNAEGSTAACPTMGGGPARVSDLRTIARLEQWLTAIDGFRAERRA